MQLYQVSLLGNSRSRWPSACRVDAWRAEKTKAQGDDTMSFAEASRILGLDTSNKAAVQAMNKKCCERHGKLARMYHPDRNPSVGKEVFEKINEAYERMILFIDGGFPGRS